MKFGAGTIRFVALIVLLAAASDYCAFDWWDLSAPMNSTGPEAIFAPTPHTTATASLHTANSPDDLCLCCSPWITPAQPAVSRSVVSSSITQTTCAPLPLSDPLSIERPPRA